MREDREHVTDAEFTVIRGPDASPPVMYVARPPWWARDPDKPDKPWDWRWYTRGDKVRYWIAWTVFVVGGTLVGALIIGLAAGRLFPR